MTPSEEFDVAVVGFGPCGAVAACWLGQAGVKTLVVEKSRTIWDIPRAVALDHEILRVFQNLGVVEDILPHTAPFGASEHFGAAGQLIRRIDVVPPPYPMGYLPNMVFSQPPVEALLRKRAGQHPSVTVELGTKLTGLSDETDGVLLTRERDDGLVDTAKAKFVIACDGAASSTRQMRNLPLDDLGFDEPWLVVDVVMNNASIAKLPSTCAQYCDPARPYTYIIGPGNHRRWEVMLLPGEDPRHMESEPKVWELLSRWLGPSDGRLWRASSYRFHALAAHRWRDGRVFLAGDAAHQQPPFIGQGMCQGIRDVTNLCWKLSAVLSGDACESLLDAYQQERNRHVRTLTARIKEIGAAICERDPERARARDEELIERGGGKAFVVTRQEIVPPLEAGLLAPEFGSGAGTLFPQPTLLRAGGNILLDDFTGEGWRLFIDGRSRTALTDVQDCGMKSLVIGGDGLPELEAVTGAWFDRHDCKAAIVRPDHYVYCGLRDIEEAAHICRDLKRRLTS